MQDFTAELIDEQTVFCEWKRPINTTVKGINFDLNKPHYILTATGHISTYGVYGNIGKHEQYATHVQNFILLKYKLIRMIT